jgi:excinuclease ABC subunit A
MAAGTVDDLLNNPASITGHWLANPLPHPLPERAEWSGRQRQNNLATLQILGADLHNLQQLDVTIPLGRLVCVTGVSGSGKSTLVRAVLQENLHRLLNQSTKQSLHGCRAIKGWRAVRRVLEVDQTPIGKTPRSCPATYIGIWDTIRRLFAETLEARMRGYGPGRFSFNVAGGRCAVCEGQGMQKIAMSFLPDVQVVCEACQGERFNAETLAVRFKDKTIADVLAMNMDQAVEFFSAHVKLHHALQLLQAVGLGYLTLGQPSPTLSGGEAQRIKLVTELAKTRPASPAAKTAKGTRASAAPATLYVLDEPTVGLHMADVAKLIHVLHRLVAAGNTVVVIEHNLDVIAEADWLIDLGPEGGAGGGRLVAEGTPEGLASTTQHSHTARFLADFLEQRRNTVSPNALS